MCPAGFGDWPLSVYISINENLSMFLNTVLIFRWNLIMTKFVYRLMDILICIDPRNNFEKDSKIQNRRPGGVVADQ
jgi:hypothetical protein